MKSKLTAIVLATALTMGTVAPVTQASAQPMFGEMDNASIAAAAAAALVLILMMTNGSSSSSTAAAE